MPFGAIWDSPDVEKSPQTLYLRVFALRVRGYSGSKERTRLIIRLPVGRACTTPAPFLAATEDRRY